MEHSRRLAAMQEQDRRSDAHRVECEEQHAATVGGAAEIDAAFKARHFDYMARKYAEQGDYGVATHYSALSATVGKRGV